MKTGRNEPCPCGSGRKYKQCCLRASQASGPPENLAWRRLRSLLDEYNRRDMVRFVADVYGEVAFDEAWQRFVADDKATFDPEERDVPLFMPWFYNRWAPDAGKSRVQEVSLGGVRPTAEYLRRKRNLDPLLREYLESCLASPFSVFEILRADVGRGMLMKDLLTGTEHDVMERSASTTMEEGDIVFGQVASAGGVTLMEASQPFVIPPIWKVHVIGLRMSRFEGAITVAPSRVGEAESALLALYHEIARQLFERKAPALHNTDGDPVSLRRVVFDVPSAQEAFDALKHLALDESDEDLLHDAKRDAADRLERVRFSWLKRGNVQNPGWNNTVLGTLEIDGTRLCVEVNSERREQALREIVTEALGEKMRYRATEIQSLERALAGARESPKPIAEHAALAELPEVQAKMREVLIRHYEHWLNDKIPLLGGRTPLEAVNDPAGREAVAALVTQIERDGAKMKPPLDGQVVRLLRERLQLA